VSANITDSELIAKQARRIADLESQLTEQADMISRARQRIICIGGPLNDNLLRYTQAQLREWHSVLDCLEG